MGGGGGGGGDPPPPVQSTLQKPGINRVNVWPFVALVSYRLVSYNKKNVCIRPLINDRR